AYLLYTSKRSSNKDEFELDISKGQLASILGTIPETLSRILGKMGRQRIIRSEGSHMRILDRITLEDIATKGKKLENI
ncbi:MAG: helix-turn-helix domain-containing protein, partial [Syntrophales bacterium]